MKFWRQMSKWQVFQKHLTTSNIYVDLKDFGAHVHLFHNLGDLTTMLKELSRKMNLTNDYGLIVILFYQNGI